MNTTADTTHAPAFQQPRWTASRVFRTALAITLGVVTALVVTGALFALVFAGSGRVVLEADDVVSEVSDIGADQPAGRQ